MSNASNPTRTAAVPGAPSPSTDATLAVSARRGRIALVGLFALFFAPIFVSLTLNVVRPDWLPFGTINRGALLEPAFAVPIEQIALVAGELPAQSRDEGVLRGHWTWALWGDRCAAQCADMLAAIGRAKLTLGQNTQRVQPALLLRDGAARAATEGVVQLQLNASASSSLDTAIARVLPGDSLADGASRLLLVDPRGFVVSAYASDSGPAHWLKDIARLLRISKLDAHD